MLAQGQDTITCCVSWTRQVEGPARGPQRVPKHLVLTFLPRLLGSKPQSMRGALKNTELLAVVPHWPDVVAPEVQIGKGAWGKVFAARFHKSTMKCALKCKHHEQHVCKGSDYFHEAGIMCKLRHPFVARVIFTASRPVPAIAFELMGSSLEESTTVLNIPNLGLRDAFGCAWGAMS